MQQPYGLSAARDKQVPEPMGKGEFGMTTQEKNLEIARQYLASIGQGEPEDNLAFFAEDVVQVEFPNRLLPEGATRDLAALREATQRGRQVMTAQRFEVLNAIASGEQVAIETNWIGTLAVPFGNTPAGGQIRARFAIFLTFRDGKIVRQHNYDCFDPW
jgi:ketosteroid isomerase-like protein